MALTSSIVPASADEKQPTKKEYIAMPARAWKHFQCSYLASMAQAHTISGVNIPSDTAARPFMERGFALGIEYLEALKEDKINLFDLNLSVPRAFHTIDSSLSLEFQLGRISKAAEEEMAGEILALTGDGTIDVDAIKSGAQDKTQVNYELMQSNARDKLETHGCDFDDLGMSAEALKNYRKNLQSNLIQEMLKKRRANPQ